MSGVTLRGPTYAETLVWEVVEKMMKDERKPEILRLTRHHGCRQLSDEDVRETIRKLLAATNQDEGVTFTPWESLILLGYITKLELMHKGEFYASK